MSEKLLHRVKSVRLSDIVVNQILELVERGALDVGDRLPSERELVAQLNVGRASVREALRMLEAQGVLEVRQGKGTFIVGKPEEPADVQESLRLWFQEHEAAVFQMIEVRSALERKAAFLAGSRVTPGQIETMRNILARTEAAIAGQDRQRLQELDRQFHLMLAEASGNQLLAQLVDKTIEALGTPRRTIQALPGRARRSLQEHQDILQAIATGDPEKAERAITAHIDSVERMILSLVDSTGSER